MEEDLGKRSRRVVLKLLGIMYDIRSRWEKKLGSAIDRYASRSIEEITFSEFKDVILGYFADFHSDLSRSVVKYVQTLVEKYTSTIESLEKRVAASDTYNDVIVNLRNEVKALHGKIARLQEFLKKELLRTVKYKILAVLEEAGKLSVKELAAKLNVSERQIRKYLKELEKQEFIEIKRDIRPYVVVLLKTPWNI
ncbi:MAG: winged helix-turn-helix transcriptional regulator [Candidatus Baldrarchaeia archaeon]